MTELTLPFIGHINIWPLVLCVVGALVVWDHIPAIVAYLFKAIIRLFSRTISAVIAPTPEPVAEVKTTDTKLEGSLNSLQSLTRWAVHDAEPEVLSKITGLYSDIQKQIKDKPNE